MNAVNSETQVREESSDMNIKKSHTKRGRAWTAVLGGVGVVFAIAVLNKTPGAQSFPSGSDGSDGALTVAANAGTIVFDPMDIARWGKVLDPDGDGVYNFTTITINSGSTLKLQGDKVNRPAFWLASGDVLINGTLDLSGAPGSAPHDLSLRRVVAIPGSGGNSGGAGGNAGQVPPVPSTPGEGPGGGVGGVNCPVGGSVFCGKGGTFGGNRYEIPLVGGSGGEGALMQWPAYAFYGGGAGGGAILIGSSTSITLNGIVAANGGQGGIDNCCGALGGGGSGGGIRLVAPVLAGGGTLNVAGAGGSSGGAAGNGGTGMVRLEAFQISSSFVFTAGGAFVTRGTPVDPSTLRPASSLRVTSIDGVPVPPNASGSFVLPDVTISKNSAVSVDIQATGIPPGTIVTLQVYPQSPTDPTIVNLPTAQATLSGTLQSSTATATFTFPYGFSRGFVRASWTQ